MQDEEKRSPFASVLGIKVKEESIPEKFASYLVHRVNTETGELELGENREVKIKLANVIEMATGLKNEGDEVPVDIGKLLSDKNTSKSSARKPICPIVLLMEEAGVHIPKSFIIVMQKRNSHGRLTHPL